MIHTIDTIVRSVPMLGLSTTGTDFMDGDFSRTIFTPWDGSKTAYATTNTFAAAYTTFARVPRIVLLRHGTDVYF